MDDVVTKKVQTASSASPPAPQPAPRQKIRFALRREISRTKSLILGLLCIAACAAMWWYLTWGSTAEQRIISPAILPSPAETFGDFHSLWFDRALTRNTFATLRRVALGFGLAALVGIPLGVLCGCFPWLRAFMAPVTIFGRNIPVAALIPLTFSLFGIDELQKIMFLFIACVAFIIDDTATAVIEINSAYIDTAYTLGAKPRQIIIKVIFPLALPAIFNSLRLLFGLAFGYIMLAELITFADSAGGLGFIINTSQRRGPQTHILLVLLLIPLVALFIDRVLFFIQRELFPYQYGGRGVLRRCVTLCLRGYEDLKSLIFKPVKYADLPHLQIPPTENKKNPERAQP
jgi:ABC-type nitrate/sulfonate/bicarbonate transport system permease component